jgi:hypothetical protein
MEKPTQRSRRDFLKDTGKQVLWAAPTLTVLVAASNQPARAAGHYNGNTNPEPPASQVPKKNSNVGYSWWTSGWGIF